MNGASSYLLKQSNWVFLRHFIWDHLNLDNIVSHEGGAQKYEELFITISMQANFDIFLWQINSATTIPKFVRQSSSNAVDAAGGFLDGWSWFNEPVGISSSNAVTKPGLLEQINTTADESDYLWYSLR